jgi:signal transduction histidine kinase
MAGKEYVEFMEPVVIESAPKTEEALYFDNSYETGQPRIIGSVILILDTSHLIVHNLIIIGQNAIGALVILFLGALLIFFALERSLGPLRKLTHEVEVLGDGGDIEKISVNSVDEVGKLAVAFNTMTENLKKREQEAYEFEQKLRHAEKMEAVGTLSRGIAHDFNNILTSIEGSVFALKRFVDRGQQKYNYLVHMDNALARAHVLIDGLMVFSRGQEPKRVTVEINSLLRNLMPGIAGILGEGLVCELQVYYRDLRVMGDGFQLSQMLMNLVVNAKDAMKGGGKLLIKTGMVTFGEEEKIIGLLSEPGKYAFIVISDSGEGIKDEIRERIFEPFFTTKEVGKGTGLGLSIVYGIVKDHKGHLEVYSEPGIGTEFRIYLPLFEKA